MDPAIVGKAADYVISQGLLGIACVALASIIVYQWRLYLKRQTDFDERLDEERTRLEEVVAAERTRHATELAAERKANAELQEKRFVELKAASETVSKALAILDATTLALKGRGLHERA